MHGGGACYEREPMTDIIARIREKDSRKTDIEDTAQRAELFQPAKSVT